MHEAQLRAHQQQLERLKAQYAERTMAVEAGGGTRRGRAKELERQVDELRALYGKKVGQASISDAIHSPQEFPALRLGLETLLWAASTQCSPLTLGARCRACAYTNAFEASNELAHDRSLPHCVHATNAGSVLCVS